MHNSQLPFRVKGAKINPDYLELEIAEGWKEIPWDKIKLFTLGILEQKIGIEDPPKSFVSTFFRGVLMGEKPTEHAKRKSTRVTYLLDMLIEGESRQYRIDSSFFNYRSLLGEVDHISIKNFKRMMILLISHARDSKLDMTIINFLTKKTPLIKIYSSVYDYELDMEYLKKTPGQQIPQCEANIEQYQEDESGTETL